MEKPSLIVLASLAICLVAFTTFVPAEAQAAFIVKGKIYCDTCRVEFETRLSEPIKGATVNLECRNRTTGVVTLSQESKTDDFGKYEIQVVDDHEEDICEVSAVESPRQGCSESMSSWNSKARVLLTAKNGVSDSLRFANSLGFLIQDTAVYADCPQVLQEMGFNVDFGKIN